VKNATMLVTNRSQAFLAELEGFEFSIGFDPSSVSPGVKRNLLLLSWKRCNFAQ
jgi:hypothetical protein